MSDPVDPAQQPRAPRLALGLFALYVAFYLGFMLITALKPAAMAETPFLGINLAILYGMGLIFAAFLLALIYMFAAKH